MTASGAVIPISVGKSPRQLDVTDDAVYVTNYNSSDLTMIDTKTSRVVGDAAHALGQSVLALGRGGTLWVGSPPENRLTKVLTGRDG